MLNLGNATRTLKWLLSMSIELGAVESDCNVLSWEISVALISCLVRGWLIFSEIFCSQKA